MIKNKLAIGFLITFLFTINNANAGVSLGGTRVIFPSEKKQVSLPINTNSEEDAFLIQSWVEPENSDNDKLFTITPPLFMMKGKKDNQLRILIKDSSNLPKDRESLFWINVKSIPASDKEDIDKNILQFSVTNRIKMFYRPGDVAKVLDLAPSKLKFSLEGGNLKINNPSPVHLTLVNLKYSDEKLNNTMLSPYSEKKIPIKTSGSFKKQVTFSLINDYGATTDEIVKIID